MCHLFWNAIKSNSHYFRALMLMFSVGGSLPVIFSYFSEFQAKNRRGLVVSLLASFWMCGTIVAAGQLQTFQSTFKAKAFYQLRC